MNGVMKIPKWKEQLSESVQHSTVGLEVFFSKKAKEMEEKMCEDTCILTAESTLIVRV